MTSANPFGPNFANSFHAPPGPGGMKIRHPPRRNQTRSFSALCYCFEKPGYKSNWLRCGGQQFGFLSAKHVGRFAE
jgi:hypothetical protein